MLMSKRMKKTTFLWIETPKLFTEKTVTVDSVHEVNPSAQYGPNLSTGSFQAVGEI